MIRSPKKVIFIGITHLADDARLYYRQALALLNNNLNIEITYSGVSSFEKYSKQLHKRYHILDLKKYKQCNKILKKIIFLFETIKLKADIIHIPGAHALLPGIIISMFTWTPFIYDCREDYFNQSFEYSNKTLRSFFKGAYLKLLELLYARFAKAVFCTDDYLYNMLKKNRYGIKNIYLCPNFVNFDREAKIISPKHVKNGAPIKLIYIGAINEHRGVLEAAAYVHRFNKEQGKIKATFDIFAPSNHLHFISNLINNNDIFYKGFIDHDILLNTLSKYHIGVCLLKKIKKYYRNLPIKNFEYMAIGLPVISSNFGNSSKYVKNANGGICINPESYEEFISALDQLKNRENWETFSRNGQQYSSDNYRWDVVVKPYLDCFC